MKIQTLQGINFENKTTTVKAKLDRKVDYEIIEEIKAFHPIFLEKYTIENKNILIVQTKLPYLWQEIARVLNENIDLKSKREKILKEIIQKQIKSMSTISVLQAAKEMDEEITPFLKADGQYERQYKIGCGKRSESTIFFSSSKDSAIARLIQTDKYLTNQLTNRLNIPLAKWEIVPSKNDLKEIFNQYTKPVVIKPTSLAGGHGVNTNIHSYQQALQAYENAQEAIRSVTELRRRSKIIIQKQVQGEDFRLLVVDGKLEAVTKRVPAFVEGNGKSTVEELIKETNKQEQRDTSNPTHTLKPISINQPLIDYLKEQGLSLKHVPKNKEKITVRKIASMSQGGITIDYTEKVSKHIKYICESIAQTINAYTLGVDIICQDISKPLTIENGSLIEINTMPEAYLNLYPLIGKQRPEIAKKFVKGLLKNKNKTKKIVIIGDIKQHPILKGNTGVYYQNSIYINKELINQNVETHKAIESLKLNSFLDNIVLHHKNISEAKKHGLGFDLIDELHFNKEYKKDINKLDKSLIKKYEIFNN